MRVIAFFIFVTFLVTFPLAQDLDSWLVFSNGGEKIRVSDQLSHMNILSKMGETIVAGENLLSILFFKKGYYVPPTYSIFGGLLSRVTNGLIAHNILSLIFLFLSGITTYLLFMRFGLNLYISMVCGALFMATNIHMHHFVDSAANQMYWIPLFILVLDIFLFSSNHKSAVLLGFVAGLMVISRLHMALYLYPFIPIFILFRNWQCIKSLDFWKYGMLSVVTAAVICGPYLYMSKDFFSGGPIYPDKVLLYFSVQSILDFFKPNSQTFIGPLFAMISFIGIAHILLNKNKKFYCWVFVLIISTILVFGPFSEFSLYSILNNNLPFFEKTRTPIRFFPVMLLSLTIFFGHSLNIFFNNKIFKKLPSHFRYCFFSVFILVIYTSRYYPSGYFKKTPNGKGIWTVKKIERSKIDKWSMFWNF